ncbi:MAG TPA: hypothetical protein PKE03_11355 [Bacteroidales bacterium]|nr:hypothetical protein [Bacteroidales bacterium]
MQQEAIIIEPLKGCSGIPFGLPVEELVSRMGEPEEIDHLDTDDQMNTIVLHYWELGLSIFFEGTSRPVISCFETDDMETLLFGEKVFSLTRNEIIALMKTNGYDAYELEEEEGELRLSFEDALIDFFYDGEELLAVNWGVYVDEAGEIINDF